MSSLSGRRPAGKRPAQPVPPAGLKDEGPDLLQLSGIYDDYEAELDRLYPSCRMPADEYLSLQRLRREANHLAALIRDDPDGEIVAAILKALRPALIALLRAARRGGRG